MFVDLDASSGLAESLGDLRYHQFLNEFYYDITEEIVDAHGEIYQYVGDEVVATGQMKRDYPRAIVCAPILRSLRKLKRSNRNILRDSVRIHGSRRRCTVGR